MNWRRDLKGKIRFREPLSKHTTFKIGGAARVYIEPRDCADLKILLKKTKRYKIPLRLIGRGSNILVADRGLKAAVIKLSAPYFRKINSEGEKIRVGAGVELAEIIKFCLQHKLGGLEFLWGIPGTLGGALIMNAGISDKGKNLSIGDLVSEVEVMDGCGKIKIFKKEKLKFNYRNSNLANYIVIAASLKLKRQDREKIKAQIKSYARQRCLNQELSYPSAGCIFKNPLHGSAGKLIDLCGLKGTRLGDAEVSPKHANFIINKGKAKAEDVLSLIDYLKRKVKQRFKIDLAPEIEIWK